MTVVSNHDLDTLPPPARAFVEGDADLLPGALSLAQVDALVALLVARADGERLRRLAEAKDKTLAKPARRGLNLLRTRGAAVPSESRRAFRLEGPYAASAESSPLASLASMIDGHGERVVWLVRPAEGGSGYDVYQAEISDTRGLIGFHVGAVTKKQWREHTQRVIGDGRLGVAEIPSTHARWLIEKAYQRTSASGRVAPKDFAYARLHLGEAPPPEHHPALELAPPLPIDEARPRLAELHALAEVSGWVPPREALEALDLELGQVATSRLIVDPPQKLARIASAIEKIADQTLTPAYRGQLAERLEETALLLAQGGLIQEARVASTAALLTRDESVETARNPFVRRLFEKVVNDDHLKKEIP